MAKAKTQSVWNNRIAAEGEQAKPPAMVIDRDRDLITFNLSARSLAPEQNSAVLKYLATSNVPKTFLDVQAWARSQPEPFEITRLQVKRLRLRGGVKAKKMWAKMQEEAAAEGLAVRATRIVERNEDNDILEEMLEQLNASCRAERAFAAETGNALSASMTEKMRTAAQLVKTRIENSKYVAQERGEWTERIQHSGKIDVSKLSDEELEALIKTEG